MTILYNIIMIFFSFKNAVGKYFLCRTTCSNFHVLDEDGLKTGSIYWRLITYGFEIGISRPEPYSTMFLYMGAWKAKPTKKASKMQTGGGVRICFRAKGWF